VTGDPNPLRLYDIPALAVDPHDPDTIVMAVGDARNGECGLRVSRDGGLSWETTAANLLRDPKDSCIQRALGPVMAPAFGSDGKPYVVSVAPNGRVDVAWHDFRNDPTGPRQVGQFPGRALLGRVLLVFDRCRRHVLGQHAGDQPVRRRQVGGTFDNIDTRGAIGLQSTTGAAYLAWSDSRATDANGDAEDAYFSRIRFGGVAGLGGVSVAGDDRPAWVWGVRRSRARTSP